jgi:carboxyl-terminal processing protease
VIEIKTGLSTGLSRKMARSLDMSVSQIRRRSQRRIGAAFTDLLKQNVKGIIFDLRANGGGLLDQAVKVSNYFLAKGSEVTSTKGRTMDQDRTLFANNDPLIPPDLPVVVLVNEMSASASEIVAGAVQDWDRAVITEIRHLEKDSCSRCTRLAKMPL